MKLIGTRKHEHNRIFELHDLTKACSSAPRLKLFACGEQPGRGKEAEEYVTGAESLPAQLAESSAVEWFNIS